MSQRVINIYKFTHKHVHMVLGLLVRTKVARITAAEQMILWSTLFNIQFHRVAFMYIYVHHLTGQSLPFVNMVVNPIALQQIFLTLYIHSSMVRGLFVTCNDTDITAAEQVGLCSNIFPWIHWFPRNDL